MAIWFATEFTGEKDVSSHKGHKRLRWKSTWTFLFLPVCLVAQSCPALCDPMDCSPPGSSVHRIFQARILEWVTISFSRESSQPGDWTQVSSIAGRLFTTVSPGKPSWYIRQSQYIFQAKEEAWRRGLFWSLAWECKMYEKRREDPYMEACQVTQW